MRKYPQPPKLEINKGRVITVGHQIGAQQDKAWWEDFVLWLDNQEKAIVSAWRSGFVAREGKTIGEVSERYAGKLEVFGLVRSWFDAQVQLAKKYEKEQLKKETA